MFKALVCCTAMMLSAALSAAEANLAPMLDAGVTVPNGGILRLFPRVTLKSPYQKELVAVFDESPYKDVQPLRNMRYNWDKLERGKGEYLFDEVIEPLLQQCVKERSRVTLGLACMCGGGSPSSPKMDGQRCAVPAYLYRELTATDHPMVVDTSYGGGLTPDYDSPLLLERFRALLNAFSAWLDGNVSGRQVKRRDLVYGIEMRYFGYWGEGAVKNGGYPVTELFDGYIDAYLSAFPDILLIAPMQEILHLPARKNYDAHPANPQYVRAMKHVGRLFRERNAAGRLGFFIDCWEHKTHRADDPRVMFDGDGNVISMAQYRAANTWGDSYITGEFAYFIRQRSKNLVPYAALADQFRERHVSGISLHNFTIIDTLTGKPDPSLGNRPRTYVKPSPEIYASARRAISTLGYRIVLGSPKVVRSANGGMEASFTLANVGTSRAYHAYNRLCVFVERDGRVVEEKFVPFDLRALLPGDTPLVWDERRATPFSISLASASGDVRVSFPDAKGIEHPLCLSNRGRRASDGSYLLGAQTE